jgi:hypothetical protein
VSAINRHSSADQNGRADIEPVAGDVGDLTANETQPK